MSKKARTRQSIRTEVSENMDRLEHKLRVSPIRTGDGECVQLAILTEIARIFVICSRDEVYNEVLKVILEAMQSQHGVFGYIDESGAMVVRSMTGHIWDKCQTADRAFTFPRSMWGDSSWARAIRGKRTIYSNELSTKIPKGLIVMRRHISLPILFQGKVIGLLQVANKDTDYTEADVRTLECIGFMIAPLLDALLKPDMEEARHRQSGQELQRSYAEQLRDDANLRRLVVVVRDSNDAVTMQDFKGRIMAWNRGAERMYGYTEKEALGMSALDLVPEDSREAYRMMLASLEHGEPISSVEIRRKTKDGRALDVWLTVSVTGTPLPDEGGRILTFSTTERDISERKRAEQALRESEERLRFALDVIETGEWDLDLIDHAAHRSLKHDHIFGYETLLPQWTYEMFLEHVVPEDRAAVDQKFQQAMESKGDWHFECRIDRRDGVQRWILACGRHCFDSSGQPHRMVGIVQDITDRKKAEEKQKQMLVDLERSNKELEQFAYVASHDLQEPLRMVASFTQLLEKRYRGKLDTDADEFIKYAVDGANRMQQLINDLLTYSRLGTRGRPFESCDCQSVLRRVIVNLRTAIDENQALITNDDLPTIMADETQMIQLFQNLIGNAIKFRRKESPLIHVSAQRKDDEWVFSVRDNGIGIDPQYRERIFVIFQRLHGKEEYKGTGIGLAICQRIVERHAGRIWVDSEPGKGSTFCFTMPQRLPATLEK